MLSILFSIQVAPQPKTQNINNKNYGITKLSLQCTYKNNEECKKHIVDNFDFFVSKLFPREKPYTEAEYKQKGINTVLSKVVVSVITPKEDYSPLTINESYSLTVTDKVITIEAQNSFGISRAFASLIQLVSFHPQLPTDLKAYTISDTQINDSSLYPWRELMIDPARHYISVNDIKLEIDAMALAKFNVLHLHLIDAESFQFKSDLLPHSELFKGAYSKYYYYTSNDLKDIRKHCHERGVFLEIEIPVPSHTKSWKNGNQEIVANCPITDRKNPYLVTLNPTTGTILGYVEFLLYEIIELLTVDTPAIIHLGSGEFNDECWNEDPAIKKFMVENNMSSIQMFREFYDWLTYTLNRATKNALIKPIYVFGDEAIENDVPLPNNTIIQLSKNVKNANIAADKKYNILLSVNWELDTMSPGGQWTYLQMDTIEDLYRQNAASNFDENTKKFVIGGGARMNGNVAWGQSQNAQIYPRSFAVVENLWNPSNYVVNDQVRDRFDNLGCRFLYYGIQTGPLNPSSPCYGYPHQ